MEKILVVEESSLLAEYPGLILFRSHTITPPQHDQRGFAEWAFAATIEKNTRKFGR